MTVSPCIIGGYSDIMGVGVGSGSGAGVGSLWHEYANVIRTPNGNMRVSDFLMLYGNFCCINESFTNKGISNTPKNILKNNKFCNLSNKL